MQHYATEITHLRASTYVQRPVGQLGTAGFFPFPWTIRYITARSREAARFRSPLFPFSLSALETRPYFVFEVAPGVFLSDRGRGDLSRAAVFAESQKAAVIASGVWRELLPSGELAE